ncbi:MAG: hypothetical protein IKS96_08705 [Fibrobacter sp.]|nr:hypothetical protein [Fibrobacter sp.]
MIKNFLSASAVAALVLAACSSEDPVSPAPFNSMNSSSSIQGFLSSDANISSSIIYSSSSAIYLNDTTFFTGDAAHFTKNDCFVLSNATEKTVVLYMTYAGEAQNKTTMTLVAGDMVNLESTVLYDASISDASVKHYCEEAQNDAIAEGATVICEKRSVTAKQTKTTNGETFEEVVESAQEMCDMMKIYFPEMESSSSKEMSSSSAQILLPQSSSSAKSNPPQPGKGNATCEILEDTETAFHMIIIDPDSVTINLIASDKDGNFKMDAVAEFTPNIPQSTIDKECAKEKAEAEEDGEGVIITCDGNKITESIETRVGVNVLNLAAPSLVAECDKIQETGVIPEDDDF